MASKISYLDETLKRLPLILLCASGLWYGVTKLNTIENKVDKIEFNIFDTFMLVTDDNSNLMLSFEQDFSDD